MQSDPEAREALARLIEAVEDWVHAVGEDSSWDGWDHHYKRVKWSLLPAVRAAGWTRALPAPVVTPVRVQPLEWEEGWSGENEDIPCWRGRNPLGVYVHVSFAGSKPRVNRHEEVDPEALQAKKDAAQADYDARVRAALTAALQPPAPERSVAEVLADLRARGIEPTMTSTELDELLSPPAPVVTEDDGKAGDCGDDAFDASGYLSKLRAEGWRVAVHNDYRQHGQDWTFWLLTHPSGVWCKGEGVSDALALDQAFRAARAALQPEEGKR